MDADKLLTLWRDYQTQLAKHGDVPHTRELFFAVADAVGISLLEPERLERRLEELHSAAWPDAARRPARLHTGDLTGILEG